MSIYTENGYKNRREYLNDLADGYGVSRDTVYMLADLLGPGEDFDGLVAAVEDAADEAERQEEHNARGGGLYLGMW